ncbi:MAG: hypothetical protein JWP63_4504 [Candidatus Solibacter sp.]|nr:hypothetical protein [Candidatus Solibacter sp.]
MARPLVLIHGYSAEGKDFENIKQALVERGIQSQDINICNYISLNNEITIKDIAEGLDRAFRMHSIFGNETQEFDAIVHSTGMLVLRAWLANAGPPAGNARLKRLKHLVGLAPATWGSPQAHKGRTWLGAMVKGNKHPGPDFMNAGDRVLEGLELGSQFTWDLAHLDLLGPVPYYDQGPNTPYVAVFIGNKPYDGVAKLANDPGTDGTVRWSGCSLNTRKITMDLTRVPVDNGTRLSITPWAETRLDIPMIAVNGRNHGSLVSEPEDGMVDLVAAFLRIGDTGGENLEGWLARARTYSEAALPKMKVNPGADGVGGEVKKIFGTILGHSSDAPMEGWQQFVVHARDERGDGVADYMIEVLGEKDGQWVPFEDMYTAVHAYGPDPSFRCFHVRLPEGISGGGMKLKVRINASTGTELMAYQGYGSEERQLGPTAEPVEIDLEDLGNGNGSLFHPFTTTLIEIVLNREPLPFDKVSRILTFLAD